MIFIKPRNGLRFFDLNGAITKTGKQRAKLRPLNG